MRVLVAGEESGIIREAFKAKGHDAWSCDFKPSRIPGNHCQCDVRDILYNGDWDMLIGHPDCYFLCNSGVRWLHTEEGRWEKMQEAVKFFHQLWFAPIKKKCLENPIPHKYGLGKTYTQIIQPWQFGYKEMKATCLWLDNLDELKPTNIVGPPPKDKIERRKWAKVHRASPGPNRSRDRSVTNSGIANAMAEQWGAVE